jgi:hypothetical protein
MALAGMPAGFRLALVARNAALIAIYAAVVVEASRRGLAARRFRVRTPSAPPLQKKPEP